MPFFLPPLPFFLRSFTALPKDFKSLAAMGGGGNALKGPVHIKNPKRALEIGPFGALCFAKIKFVNYSIIFMTTSTMPDFLCLCVYRGKLKGLKARGGGGGGVKVDYPKFDSFSNLG